MAKQALFKGLKISGEGNIVGLTSCKKWFLSRIVKGMVVKIINALREVTQNILDLVMAQRLLILRVI